MVDFIYFGGYIEDGNIDIHCRITILQGLLGTPSERKRFDLVAMGLIVLDCSIY